MYAVLSGAALLLYFTAAWLLWRRLLHRSDAAPRAALFLALAGALFHSAALIQSMVIPEGINLGFSNATSLITALIVALFVLTAWFVPVENLGIILLPLAAITQLIDALLPMGLKVEQVITPGLALHILLSLLAYALLTLAAAQALLLSAQEHQLHSRRPGGLIRALPPLETMERLLFGLILVGFVVQTLALVTGWVVSVDLLAQHLIHKTVLAVTAWVVFAVLLIGHWRLGWRGRTAVRWTLAGFFFLFLSYFGSKYVLEIILGR